VSALNIAIVEWVLLAFVSAAYLYVRADNRRVKRDLAVERARGDKHAHSVIGL
jgi:hypothetical protein